MLQIASGKLFSRPVGRRNEHRGILYTNLRLGRDDPLETVAGRLLPATTLDDSRAVVYEAVELIEETPTGPGALVSRGMDPYLEEFAAISSFALNVVCTPNANLAARLLSNQRLVGVRGRPSKAVRRFFDDDVWCQGGDEARLQGLVADLIGLQRRSYRAAIRAIRTYVTGLHRLADDLELAYTLLVASIESLAQGFDGNQGSWEDYDSEKRTRIDKALADADAATAANVRSALLEIEHVSLARRFRDFTLDHVTDAYFRDEANFEDGPIGRAELPAALREAYRMRSKYIHNLEELPRIMTLGDSYRETVRLERKTMLTFQGLARLARCVITEFVRKQPKVEAEPYDYSLEQTGVVRVQMAPQYWVAALNGLTYDCGRRRLEGFAEQLASHLVGEPNASVTDLRELLAKVETLLSGMGVAQRRPFVALHILFNSYAPEAFKMPGFDVVRSKYATDLVGPTVEAMFFHLLSFSEPAWPLPEHEHVHREYFRARNWKDGLRMPKPLEAGVSLVLAERFRVIKDHARAAEWIRFAVENYPGHPRLRELETGFDKAVPIEWLKLVSAQKEGGAL
ncbi:hypothetical protein [Lysobacter sp. M15]|uniref:hypothetical protein n=1 Tax=Lysobacter sp. M15 TaxID=2916837 RepID=UPI001F575CEB|nr:hypothetical protein [Lysobacter sp. M15]